MRYCIQILFVFLILPSTVVAQRYIHNVPEAIVSILSSDQGSIIALSQSGKMYAYNGAEYTLLQDGMNGAKSLSSKDEGYVITSSTGIWKWKDGNVEHQSLSEDCYSYIAIDDNEYVLTPTGMQQYKEGRYQLINDWTTAILPTAKFHLINKEYYLTNNNVIYRYSSSTWKVLTRDTVNINDLAYYRNDIWAATGSGLRILKDKSLRQVVVEGLDSNEKVDQLFAIDDELYIQGQRNLLRWNPSNYQGHIVDAKSSPSEVAKDPWGDIWYADEGNIIQHKIGALNQSSPIISKIDIVVNGEMQHGNNIIVKEEGSDIKINYNANHLRQPQSIKYQSRLSLIDSEYQSTTTDKSIVYSDVPAGDYSYRLRTTIDGTNYIYSDTIKIKVKAKDEVSPLWWILGGTCIGLLFLALLSNYRLQQYKERSSLLTSKLRTANELLASQQKTMQLQMNPHFLFNALNSIQGLVSLNRNDEAKIYLRTFSRMMRSVLDFSTVNKIDLQQEIDYLNDYLSIEQMTRSNSFNYKINIDESLLEDDIKVPPMILQPFVENAIIHGVSSIHNGQITIDIKDQETSLHCTITDNGIGRQAASQKKISNHKSVAISLAKERLQKLSKSKTQDSIQYKDLTQGTQVEICIPI